ncbi:sarcosine oxidase subunit gamma family protein, partial [Oharaeibacter diazotrophicus]
WLIAGDAPLAPDEIRRRAAAIAADAVVLDVGHGWTRLVLSGPSAADLAATGTGIDLDPAAFPPGASAATLYGLVAVHLTRTGPDAFEMLVPHSYARDLADGLAAAIRRRAGGSPTK